MSASLLHTLAVFASILLLWKGADWIVDAAARVAKRFNVSDLVIGLTLVALGTSAPEFAVSIGAALHGQADISVGNVVGSNVFNLGFILGGCAIIRPIVAERVMVYRDGMFLIGVTVLVAFFVSDLTVSRFEGLFMIALLIGYISFLLWKKTPFESAPPADSAESAESATVAETSVVPTTSMPRDLGITVVGLAMLVGGSDLLVWGASGMARTFGLSEWAIGVTIVAAGTSAPEFVTSVNAVVKGKHGISAGNLLGSDIYNLLGVLGVAATISPLNVIDTARSSVFVLVGMVTLVIIFLRTGWRISRKEAAFLITFNAFRWWAEMTGRSWF